MVHEPRNKYSILGELQFQLALAKRYAIIVEHRTQTRLDLDPYIKLLTTAMAEANADFEALVALLEPKPEPIELTRQDLAALMKEGAS